MLVRADVQEWSAAEIGGEGVDDPDGLKAYADDLAHEADDVFGVVCALCPKLICSSPSGCRPKVLRPQKAGNCALCRARGMGLMGRRS